MKEKLPLRGAVETPPLAAKALRRAVVRRGNPTRREPSSAPGEDGLSQRHFSHSRVKEYFSTLTGQISDNSLHVRNGLITRSVDRRLWRAWNWIDNYRH